MPRGKTPKPTNLHLIAGTFRQDRHGGGGGDGRPPPNQRLTVKNRPKYLDKRAAELWTEVLPKLPWLQKTDKYCLAMWCSLQAEFEMAARLDVTAFRPARLSILRLLGSDLGLTGAGRARLGVTMAPPAEPGKDKYFDT